MGRMVLLPTPMMLNREKERATTKNRELNPLLKQSGGPRMLFARKWNECIPVITRLVYTRFLVNRVNTKIECATLNASIRANVLIVTFV